MLMTIYLRVIRDIRDIFPNPRSLKCSIAKNIKEANLLPLHPSHPHA